jgi:RNA polymerase sigma-70 factor (ECF subfamily)
MTANEDQTELLHRARSGDRTAQGALFESHKVRLRRMVELRLDRRLRGRLDASDVIQEAYVEFSRSLDQYFQNPVLPFYLWLRMITGRKLQALHRRHLGTRQRSVAREISLHDAALPRASSESLAAQLLGHFTPPSQAAMRAELKLQIQEALATMEPLDREVLSLRHFEQLSNSEIAQVLEISEAAASNRFVRALRRLKGVLSDATGIADFGANSLPGPSPEANEERPPD